MTAFRRKRKADDGDHDDDQAVVKLAVDDKVEVRSVDDGLKGSWHTGTVIGRGEKTRTIRYDELMVEGGTRGLIEAVEVRPVLDGLDEDSEASEYVGYRGNIRPVPPPFSESRFHYGICVDAFYNEAWWEGVILDREESSDKRKVFFPDLGDEMGVKLDKMRLTQDWNEVTGEWKLRGWWPLLEVLQQVESPGVSVRQIWYELQVPFALRELEWTCSGKEVWKELVLEVLCLNYRLYMQHILQESSSAEYVEENRLLVESLSSGSKFLIEPEELFSKNQIVAAEPGSSSTRKRLINKPKSSTGGGKLNWLTVAVEAENLPDSITQYISSRRSQEIAEYARKHLVHLGWEAQSARDKRMTRMRYISPEGLVYFSLYQACLALHSKERALPPPVYKGVRKCLVRTEAKNSTSQARRTKRVPALVKKGRASVSSKMVVYDNESVHVGKGHLPQALVEYSKLRNSMKNTRIKMDKETEKLSLEVKQHLTASGWRISRHTKGGKNELLYVAPTGKKFHSLLKVCEWCIENENSEQVTGNGALVLSTLLPKQLDQIGEIKTQERRRKHRGRNPVVDLTKKSDAPARALKRVRKEATSSTRQTPRTILSWLIDGNVISPREKVQYKSRKDGLTLKHGMITREGIKCSCCQQLLTLSGFEAHAGSNLHRPSASIFLKDGRSLFQCQMQLKQEESNAKKSVEESGCDSLGQPESDGICSVCRDGGGLLLCDQCPSAYHAGCVGLQGIPPGDWFCPTCCCAICGLRVFNEEEELSSINCGQCEHRHHIECLRSNGLVKPDFQPDGIWFCNTRCEQIYSGLQNILGKPIPVGNGEFRWTLLKHKGGDSYQDALESEHVMENYGKLKVALSIMHECFVPYIDSYSGTDIAEDVMFSRRSDLPRLNFEGFYTVVLEKNDDLITVANIRIYGGKVAEMPLIGTRFQYRRLGMCRILMNELEKRLMELGVERLVLPAIPELFKTWKNSFGFSLMEASEKLNYIDCRILDFFGTYSCQKLLQKAPPEKQHKMVNLEINDTEVIQEFRVVNKEAAGVGIEGAKIGVGAIQHKMHAIEINNTVSKAFQGFTVEDIEMVDQESADVSRGVKIDADGIRAPETQTTTQEQENQLPIARDTVIKVYRRRNKRAKAE